VDRVAFVFPFVFCGPLWLNQYDMDGKTLRVLRAIRTLILCSLLLGGCQTAVPTPAAPTVTSQPAPAEPQQDGIRITKYPQNYTAFKIEIQDGPTIITDPFVLTERVHADIVTESHQHMDHTDVSHILEPYTLLTKPGAFDVAGVKITGVGGAHNKYESNPLALSDTNVIYVFDLGDMRLAQFASQGELPTPAMFAQIGKVDVLIIQIFSAHDTKLNMLDAEKIANELSAQVIIPAHGEPGLNEEFAQHIGADFKEEPSGVLELNSSDLDQLKKPVVVVLDH
jgi:L-ascorbate metabolism protein UlaG (beta-lactamase superfamily)